MVGLALIAKQHGWIISGSDMSSGTNTELLQKKNIPVTIGHSPENLPNNKNTLVVRSSAVSEDNVEFMQAEKCGYITLRRGEMLANIASIYNKTIAVAGSHGKTSVTAQLAHLLKCADMDPGYIIGGKVCSWNEPANAGSKSIFITESDESDGTQIHLKSDILLITNIEDDHSWSVGGSELLFANFATIAKNAKRVIYNKTPETEKILASHPNAKSVEFDKNFLKNKTDWGPFQKENAYLTMIAAMELGINQEDAIPYIISFPGVERRMSIRYKSPDFTIIEDYAHHPTEVKAAITSLRLRFPEHRLRVIFQPHRYARLAKYINEFAEELAKADDIIIVPVFSAWTEKGPVDASDLVKKIGEKAIFHNNDWQTLADTALNTIQKPEVLAIFGAGDIENVIPWLKK